MTTSGAIGRDDLTPGEGEAEADRRRSNDLVLELYRQQTLLQILTARMRETASVLEHRGTFDVARLRRGLDVHRRYLLDVHEADEERLVRSLARRRVVEAEAFLQELNAARASAVAFERTVEDHIAASADRPGETARDLARLVSAEAERIDHHQQWEAERLHGRLDEWLPRATQGRLLAQIRKFDAARVDAEIALISWASQLHPSAD